jgi:hypothetical protein
MAVSQIMTAVPHREPLLNRLVSHWLWAVNGPLSDVWL